MEPENPEDEMQEPQGKQGEDQRIQQSSMDRANNLVNKGRTVAKTAKDLKRAYKALRRTRLAITLAQSAIALLPIEIPGAIIAAVILFFIIIIAAFVIIILPQPAKGGQPPDCTTAGGKCGSSDSCISPNTVNNSFSCNTGNPSDVCCISARTCESIGGTCSSDTTCADVSTADQKMQPDTSGATCNDPSDPSKTTCCVPKSNLICDPDDPVKSLKDNFNINTTIGVASKELLDYVCRVYLEAMAPHPTYLSLFKSQNSTFTFVHEYEPHGAYGVTSGNGNVKFYQGFLDTNASYKKYVLVHESGHVVGNANDYLQKNLYNQSFNAGVDLACFNLIGILKTYPTRVLFGTSIDHRVHETFAESLYDTLYCPSNGTCHGGSSSQTIPNFPSTCDFIYNYMRSNLL